MQSLMEEAKVVSIFSPASRSSAATGDWISLENYDKITMIFDVGGVTAGGNIKFYKAKTAAGGSSAQIEIGTFYERTVSTDTWTKNSADSSGSHDCVTIGNSSDSKTFVVEVTGAQATPAYPFVSCKVPAAFSACVCTCIGILHKTRYQSSAPPSALS